MKVLRTISVLNKTIDKISNLGFVPTMGKLHNGHISLIKTSQRKCSKTIVSIYVNPKQFESKKDFTNYPRNLKKDLQILKKLKVNFVFLPTTKEIYKKKTKKIRINKSQKVLCGKFRKGHFEGVLDVMGRFINLIKPRYIFMGEKDFQQIYLIKNFIKNKFFSKVYSCITIRDRNNVALSSRNNLLSKVSLNKVSLITNILRKITHKKKSKIFMINHLNLVKKNLIKKFNINIEYLEARNDKNLCKLNVKKKYRIFIAYYINNVRLIDNF